MTIADYQARAEKLAYLVAAHYNALIRDGMPHEQAFYLSIRLHDRLYRRIFNTI